MRLLLLFYLLYRIETNHCWVLRPAEVMDGIAPRDVEEALQGRTIVEAI